MRYNLFICFLIQNLKKNIKFGMTYGLASRGSWVQTKSLTKAKGAV